MIVSDDEFGEEDLQPEQKQPPSVGATRRRSSSISGGREEERERPKGEGSTVLVCSETVELFFLSGYWFVCWGGRRGAQTVGD